MIKHILKQEPVQHILVGLLLFIGIPVLMYLFIAFLEWLRFLWEQGFLLPGGRNAIH